MCKTCSSEKKGKKCQQKNFIFQRVEIESHNPQAWSLSLLLCFHIKRTERAELTRATVRESQTNTPLVFAECEGRHGKETTAAGASLRAIEKGADDAEEAGGGRREQKGPYPPLPARACAFSRMLARLLAFSINAAPLQLRSSHSLCNVHPHIAACEAVAASGTGE